MKTIFKIVLIVFMATLWACEKNDPLGDQGELTGNIVPFNLLAQMPDAAAGDTLTLRNVSWAVEDNIETISFFHRGFKKLEYTMGLAIPGTDTLYVLSASFSPDSILTPLTPIADYPKEGEELNQYYQTLENAYVIQHDFIVPQIYKLISGSNGNLVLAMDDATFGQFMETFSVEINRHMLLGFFPDLNAYSTVYFKFDDDGNFTGELTDAGVEYFLSNITREIINEFLEEATVEDDTRVTIETQAVVEESTTPAVSTRVFKVI